METDSTSSGNTRFRNPVVGVQRKRLWYQLLYTTSLVLGLLLVTAQSVEASHFRYGDISWRVVESDPTGRTIEFKVNTGWRLNAVNNIYLYFGDGSGASMSRTVTNVNGEYSYSTSTVTHRYSGNGNFTAYYRGCCKISNLANNRDDAWFVRSTVNVGTGNNSPVTTLPAIVNLQTNQSAAQFTIPATDPDGDNLSFALASTAHGWPSGSTHPSGISINSSTGEVTFNTNGKNIGTLWNTAVAISDGQTTVIVDYIIKITQVSTPPSFNYSLAPPNGFVYNVSPGQPISFQVGASDSDPNANVSINGIGIPAGASVSPNFGTLGNPIVHNFSWTPQPHQFGTYVMNFIAQDNNGVQSQTSVSVVVSLKPQFNVPPTPAEGVHTILTPGVNYTFPVEASDPDPNDVVSIISATGKDMSGNPIPLYPGASFATPTPTGNPSSGSFSWTPQASDWGHKHVIFTAEDSYGDRETHEISQLVNSLPSFTSTPNLEAIVGEPYQYQISATDPDLPYGDLLAIVGTGLPSWLSVQDNGNGTATLFGTPTLADVGPNPTEVSAEDLHHHHYLSSVPTQNFVIEVSDCRVQALCQDFTLALGSNGQAMLNPSDIDGGSSVTCGPMQLSLSKTEFFCWDVGVHSVVLTVTDNKGNSETCTAQVTVIDNVAPVAVCQNIQVSLDANGEARINQNNIDAGSDDACGLNNLILSEYLFTCEDLGINYVSMTVIDHNGNTDTCTAAVTVVDDTAPTALAQDLVIQLDSNGQANITAADVDAGSFDNCSISSLSIDQTNFDCSNIGDNVVTLTVNDPSGNSAAPLPQGLIGHWDFEGTNPLADLVGNFGDLELFRNASISNGELDVNAGSLVRSTSYTGPAISSKTLISFAKIQDLNLRSGSILSLDGITNDNFDAIVYAERQANRWMNGSSYFRRTQDTSPGFAESVTNQTVMMAITYQHLGGGQIRITLYRNAQLIGAYTSSNASSWSSNNVEALFGCRHSYGDNPVGQMDALIDEAMVYGRALSSSEIQDIYNGFTSGGANTATATITVQDNIAPTAECHPNISATTDPGVCHSVQLKKEILHYDPVGYQTASSLVNPASSDAGVHGGPLFGVGYPDQYNNHVKPVGPVSQSSTIDVNQYVEFSVSLDDFTALASVAFQKYSYRQRGGTVSSIRSNLDGYASDISQIATNPINGQILEYDLTSLGTVKGDITFRLYFWGASGDWMDIVSSVYGGLGVKLYEIDLGSFSDNCDIANLSYTGVPAKCEFPLGVTTVSVLATDASGNTSSCDILIEVEDVIPPTISCPENISVTAQRDDCDPQIFWEEPVADDNCSFTVSSSHASGDEFPVGTTTVTYTVTDVAGNSTSCSFDVTVTPEPIELSSELSLFEGGYNISCAGFADGSIDLSIEGGCLPYSFDWSNGATSEDLAGLTAGNYSVVVSDANGTNISASFTLTEPEPLAISVSDNQTVYLGYDPAACASIGLFASGGVAPYSFSWSNGFDGKSQEVCPEESTEYTVTVTDANGCQVTDAIMVCVIDIRSRDKKGNIKAGKVDICHVPPGNPGNAHTISISVNAVADHLAEHGDYLGACGTNPSCLDDGLEFAYQPGSTSNDDEGTSQGNSGRSKKKDNSNDDTFDGVKDFNLTVSPNPFSREFNVSFNMFQDGAGEIQLMDLAGKTLKVIHSEQLQSGSKGNVIVSTDGISSGVYLIKVQAGGNTAIKRVIKQ